jgi:hypothetical protein
MFYNFSRSVHLARENSTDTPILYSGRNLLWVPTGGGQEFGSGARTNSRDSTKTQLESACYIPAGEAFLEEEEGIVLFGLWDATHGASTPTNNVFELLIYFSLHTSRDKAS